MKTRKCHAVVCGTTAIPLTSMLVDAAVCVDAHQGEGERTEWSITVSEHQEDLHDIANLVERCSIVKRQQNDR